MDYTKYRLKPEAEISGLLDGVDSIYLLHCQKCFKEYDAEREPECRHISLTSGGNSAKIAGCSRINFLCSRKQSEPAVLSLEPGFNTLGVISCGLGVQAVSQIFPEKNVIALADSVPHGGNSAPERTLHGISPDNSMCSACGQCWLDRTGGICPVSNCAKSLLNGPCGGASGGKCETDKNRNCAWEDIYTRLKKQGKTFSKTVETMDFSVFPFDEKKSAEESNRAGRDESFYGGVRPCERKGETEKIPLEKLPEPAFAAVFLSQHSGNPAKPAVRPGDQVKIGTKIGEADGFISSAVHAGISGKVLSIEEKFHPAFQKKMPAVIIENDGKSAMDDSIEPLKDPLNAPPGVLLEQLGDKGITGLGGAMFPAHVKLSPQKPVDALIINGAECEPFLNADNRLMIEFPERIIFGTLLILRLLKAKTALIAVEENKPEAAKQLSMHAPEGIKVVSVPSKYPQGAEKMLIKSVLGRSVPDGGLPMDAGAAVFNVGTADAVRAAAEGMPLIERALTVSGDYEGEKGNFIVKIGTPLLNILSRCGVDGHDPAEGFSIKMGGPMMGIPQSNLETYTIKGTTGFTIQEKPSVEASEERECIKCGRCVEACPMELEPLEYVYLFKSKKWEEFRHHKLSNCFECGACEYVCASKISIVNLIKKAKSNVCAKN